MEQDRIVSDVSTRIVTTFVSAGAARGWTKRDLAKKTGLSLSTIYYLDKGEHEPSAKAITAIMGLFPDLPYERLFVPADSTVKQLDRHQAEQTEAAAAA